MNKPAYLRILLVVRVILGIILLYAGIVKSMDIQSFADAIYSFRVLPTQLINLMAMTLPIVEIIIGFMLVIGLAARIGLLAASFLLAVFSLALGQALIRGLNIDCGCFGSEKMSLFGSALSFVRDAVLLAGATLVYIKSRTEQN